MRKIRFTEAREKRIKYEICKLFDTEWGIITSKKRSTEIVEARTLYCALVRNVFEMPLTKIAKNLNITHASVIHAVKKFNGYCEMYKNYDTEYNRIKELVINEKCVTFLSDELEYLEKKRVKIQNSIDQLLLTLKN